MYTKNNSYQEWLRDWPDDTRQPSQLSYQSSVVSRQLSADDDKTDG